MADRIETTANNNPTVRDYVQNALDNVLGEGTAQQYATAVNIITSLAVEIGANLDDLSKKGQV